jgi:hypothetical protein
MELTPEKVRQMLNILLLEAKRQRSNIPYSKIDSFPNAVVFLGPNIEPVSMPVTWRDEREKYAKMEAVSKTAKAMLCQAVALISDTRWADEERITELLGIRPTAEIGVEAFQEEYKRVVHERYGGYLGNAPKGLYSEAVMIAMKGPRLNGPQVLQARYEEGPKDTIRWTGQPEKLDTLHFNLVPDWWC